MEFTSIGRTGGDGSTPYRVTDYQAKTVIEFINEVLEECPYEWGEFEVRTESNGFHLSPRVGYKQGELRDEIPDEWQYRFIEYVEATGCWSRTDYYIHAKD